MLAVLAILAVIAVSYIAAGLVFVKTKTGSLRANVFGGEKHLGPGWHFLWRPFQWLAKINDSNVHSVQKQTLLAEIKIEAKNKASVTIKLRLIRRIVDLVRYLDFPKEDFEKSVLDHLEGVATDLARACKDLDEIYEKVKNGEFEAKLLACFQELMPSSNLTVGEYHGIAVDSVVISDVELPKEIEQAALEDQVAELKAKALKTEAKGLRDAAKTVQGRTPKGEEPKLSKDRAFQIVQAQQGKIDISIEEFGLSPQTLKTLEKDPGSAGLAVWGSALLNRISGAKSGRRGGPKKKGDK